MKVVSDGNIKEYNTFQDCVDAIYFEVWEEAFKLYDNDAIDKMAVEDIVFNLRDFIVKEQGFSHPELDRTWEIIVE